MKAVSPNLDWLYIEVAVCFGASLLNIPFGLVFLPGWIGDVLSGEYDAVRPILYTLGGVLGTLGIALTLFLIGGWRPSFRVRRVIQTFVLVGLIAVVVFPIDSGLFSASTWEDGMRPGVVIPLVFAFVLPLTCSAHLIYLARDQLLRHDT